MPRQLRVQFPGAIYHISVRGNGREAVFLDHNDKRYFLHRLSESVEGFGIRLYLFCVMSNHFHLVLETPMANLSRFMQSILTGYGVYFNRRHRRHGHVTQGRYGARLVEGNEYLLKLSRYVHLNPVKVKALSGLSLKERIGRLRNYAWSSYPSYAGMSGRLEFVEYGPMLSLMAGRKAERPDRYRRYVESGIDKDDEEFLTDLERSPRSIGSEKFTEWVDECYAELLKQAGVKKDVLFRQSDQVVSPEEVLRTVADAMKVKTDEILQRRRSSMLKGLAGWMLCKQAGLTRRKAAAVIGLATGSAMTYQLRNTEDAIRSDTQLQKLVSRIEKKLNANK